MRPARRKKSSTPVTPCLPPHTSPDRAAAGSPSPSGLIESQITSSSEPVLGLYLHTAYNFFMSTYEEGVGRGEITPNVIGVLGILALQPGLSQADLARLIGLERSTIGVTVARAIASGFVKRTDSGADARRYSLFLTRRGEQMLVKLRQRIPEHERRAAGRLTLDERLQLRALLDKLVYG